MRILLLLSLAPILTLIGGCQATHIVTDPTSALTAPLGTVKTEITSAHDDLGTALVLTTQPSDAPARTAILRADQHAQNALVALRSVDKAIKTVAKSDIRAQTQAVNAQAKIDAHKNDLLGPLAHRIIWWVVGIGIFLVILLGVLRVFATTNPVVGVIYNVLLGVLTFGMSWVHSLATKLTQKLTQPSQPGAN